MDTHYTRRRFLTQTALAAGMLPIWPEVVSASDTNLPTDDAVVPPIHIFSKHLQFLNYTDMADAAASMGFAGVDLTVRPDGHVRPERVEEELPKAAEALRKAGLPPRLMTTAVGDATSPVDQRLLKTAARLGFQAYRMAWYQYDEKRSLPASIQQYQNQIQALAELNKALNLIGCYQNHAGVLVGSDIWEIWKILQKANPQHMGVQYDIRHATVEGGTAWPNGLRLILPQIKAITLKDFHWAKKGDKWVVQDVPIGEGMIDFKTYFAYLKKHAVNVPITLHIEYPVGGAEHGKTTISVPKNEVFAAMKRDMSRIKTLWQEA
ncbi:sugar phosphate isomerase/epimerase family protein [Spirosoma panaciterrae]|uniref:sugar phosphate isomerase/epimerase family protein n=1 Tax=Spirosoma panaciterrae TaxID=496058 RepID=UPI000370631B|nr:sugar phosphate isomerase/epimerase family protein [Spirosoma panaciterrae]